MYMYIIPNTLCVCYPHKQMHYTVAYVDTQVLSSPTIYHRKCHLVFASGDVRCLLCKQLRKSLHAVYSRLSKQSHDKENRTAPSSHVNYRHLSTPEKQERLSRLHDAVRVARRRPQRIEARLERTIEKVGESVDSEMHKELCSIASGNDVSIQNSFAPGSCGRIFWDQQKMAVSTSASGMRWHPLMIKWCLHLCHFSSSGYEALRKSGCISLPSQRTLRDYTHFELYGWKTIPQPVQATLSWD